MTFAWLLALASLLPFQQELPKSPPPPVTTIVLVRHAEAMAGAGRDPALSEAGAARAEALAAALVDLQVRAVFTTQYQRTVLTGRPTAEAANAPLIEVPVSGGIEPYAADLVRRVHAEHAGGAVVIVGHSNTVPALVKAFSGIDPGEIRHDEYDRLFVVTTNTPGWGRVVRARYGT